MVSSTISWPTLYCCAPVCQAQNREPIINISKGYTLNGYLDAAKISKAVTTNINQDIFSLFAAVWQISDDQGISAECIETGYTGHYSDLMDKLGSCEGFQRR